MAIYQYRCDRDGIIDVRRPIGTAPPSNCLSELCGRSGACFFRADAFVGVAAAGNCD